MSQQKTNLFIFSQIKKLADGLKLKGDAAHDAVIISYCKTDPPPIGERGDFVFIQGFFHGCPCRMAEIVSDRMRHNKDFREAVFTAVADFVIKHGEAQTVGENTNKYHETNLPDPTKN
jgi:hypothetical protein